MLLLLALLACGTTPQTGDSGGSDAAGADGGGLDGGEADGGADAGTADGGGEGDAGDGGSDGDGGEDGGSGDGGAEDGGSGDGGAEDGGSEPAPACPEDMAPVPTDDPLYCLDLYEGTVTEGRVESLPDVVPAIAWTFDDARLLCEATPVHDTDGAVAGYKRLATLDEWIDGADGLVGAGGTLYPYGDTWEDDRCATPLADGTPVLDDLVPTGSYPDCVSAFGVFDQVGNAWEWADPGIAVDPTGWFAARAAEGLELEVDDDGLLRLVSGDLEGIHLEVAGVDTRTAALDDQQRLVVAADLLAVDDEDFAYTGYLVPAELGEVAGDDFLPLQVDRDTTTDGLVALRYLPDEAGMPVTAKVGCAWYVGGQAGCIVDTVSWYHPHDFDGSIGIRCASDPIW